MLNLPYMGGYPQKVIGESSTQPTLFGVIGMFRGDEKFQALQQVVERPSSFKIPPIINDPSKICTDRHLTGVASKTHIPGLHYGMQPFAGRFMTEHGNVEVYHGHAYHDDYKMKHHDETPKDHEERMKHGHEKK